MNFSLSANMSGFRSDSHINDTSTTDFKQNSNLSWLKIQHLYNSYVYRYIAALVRYCLFGKGALV